MDGKHLDAGEGRVTRVQNGGRRVDPEGRKPEDRQANTNCEIQLVIITATVASRHFILYCIKALQY